MPIKRKHLIYFNISIVKGRYELYSFKESSTLSWESGQVKTTSTSTTRAEASDKSVHVGGKAPVQDE